MDADRERMRIATLPAGSVGPQGICLGFLEWSQLATNWINTLRYWVENMALGDREKRDHCLAAYGRRSRGFDPIVELGEREPGSEYEPFMAEIDFYCQLIEKMSKQDKDARWGDQHDRAAAGDNEPGTEFPDDARIKYLEGALAKITTGDMGTYDETNPLGFLEWSKRFAKEAPAGEVTT